MTAENSFPFGQPANLWLSRAGFLKRFLSSPRTVGSVTPSSRWLVEAMAEPVDWHRIGSIVELGAGTGVFTQMIADHIAWGKPVLVSEIDPDMSRQLHACFPHFLHFSDAANLSSVVESIGLKSLDCVVSGLPFALFTSSMRHSIVRQVAETLAPGGLFVAFQYSLQMRTHLVAAFSKVQVKFVPLNIPPAFVYVCQK